MKQARGQTKRLLIAISEIQTLIGSAHNKHFNDRSQSAFAEAQAELERAFRLCVDATSEFDPSSYDPALQSRGEERGNDVA